MFIYFEHKSIKKKVLKKVSNARLYLFLII